MFLTALAQVGNLTKAAQMAGVNRKSHYWWLEKDPEYRELYQNALDSAIDLMEAEAWRRGVFGVDHNVYHKGRKIDTYKVHSDNLLMFLLKANRPDKFRDLNALDIDGRFASLQQIIQIVNGPVTVKEGKAAISANGNGSHEKIQDASEPHVDPPEPGRDEAMGGNGQNVEG